MKIAGFQGRSLTHAMSAATLAALTAWPLAIQAQEAPPDFVREYLKILASDDTGPNATASGTAIIETCATGANGDGAQRNQDFQNDCNLLVGQAANDTEGVTGGVNSLAANQVSAQNAVAVRRSDANLSVVSQRMSLLRFAANTELDDNSQLIAHNALLQGATGSGASADSDYGRLGMFLNGKYVTGDEDQNRFQDGYDFDGWGALAGFDYRFSDNFVAGIAFNYSEGDTDYDNNRGSLDSELWGGMLYATFFLDSGFYIDGLIGYDEIEYDMDRTVSYDISGSSARQSMRSSTDSELLSGSLGVGYSFHDDAWSFTPSLRVDYMENDVDGYRESASNASATGGAMELEVGSTSYESLTSNLGIQIANAISTEDGVIVPQISLDWVHEFEDDGNRITARYRNDINRTNFVLGTTSLDSDYLDLSMGISAQFSHGLSGFASYRTLLEYDDLSYHAFEAGVRWEF